MQYELLINNYNEGEHKDKTNRLSFMKFIRFLYCCFSVMLLIGFSCITNGNRGIGFLLFSFFPSFFYLYMFKKKIQREISFVHVIEMVLYGSIISVIFASVLEYVLSFYFFYFSTMCFTNEVKRSLYFVYSIIVFFYFFFIIAYVEEFSKIIPMLFVYINISHYKNEYKELPLVNESHILEDPNYEEGENVQEYKRTNLQYIIVNDELEYIFFSLCCSAGFSSTENLFYSTQTTKDNFFCIIILRNLICVLFHMCCTGISSYNIYNYVNHKYKNGCFLRCVYILGSLFSSSLFHAVYDYTIYFSSMNIPSYQIIFLKILFTYSFISILLMFFFSVIRNMI
ncbi:putative membrane protein [Plasmodium reichenowi]|uniref:Putative membrane protein n=1 Tax=Plasmodium reichenowi TaxID=5854 RepID=A0A151LPJ8_PLARE|nr:putative membrane protein [Plasmodium reichenowi]KYO01163.1 putative membrane protein [Plasmodium reichenowi]